MKAKKLSVLERIQVPLSALMRRINRKLSPDHRQIRKSRSPAQRTDLGEFYVLDLAGKSTVDDHVDPEALARRLKALTEYEELAKWSRPAGG